MITIYGRPNCGWCDKVKDLATTYKLKYDYRSTDSDAVLNELKLRLPNVKIVPQIWWYETYIGGYEDFVTELQNTMGDYGNGKI